MLQFIDFPGPRERQIQRLLTNPFFQQRNYSQEDINSARLDDKNHFEQFLQEFRQTVEQAVSLDTKADADDVLALKEKLEKLYTRCSGQPGDNKKIIEALKQLLSLITKSLISAANNDNEALQRITDDIESMELHLRLSDDPLVSDILNQDEIITEDELTGILLLSPESSLQSCLYIFAPEQLETIISHGHSMIESLNNQPDDRATAQHNLGIMEQWLQQVS